MATINVLRSIVGYAAAARIALGGLRRAQIRDMLSQGDSVGEHLRSSKADDDSSLPMRYRAVSPPASVLAARQ